MLFMSVNQPIPREIFTSLNRLAGLIQSGVIRQVTVSKATGVNQGQISRILSGKITRVSPNVEKLCNYADSLSQESVAEERIRQEIIEAALRLWDGTGEQGLRLKQLFLAIDELHSNKKETTP